jgi:hypothetical protein
VSGVEIYCPDCEVDVTDDPQTYPNTQACPATNGCPFGFMHWTYLHARAEAEDVRRAAAFNELIALGQGMGTDDVRPCICGRMPPCRHIDDPEHPKPR